MSHTFDALAAQDISLEGFLVKQGETITVDKSKDKALMLTPNGLVNIPDAYIGDVVKVYKSVVEYLG